MSLTGIPSKEDLKELISQVLAGATTLEDHETDSLRAAFEAELPKFFAGASTELLVPLMERIDALNSTLTAAIAESAQWRTTVSQCFAIIERLNLSPPK